MSDPLINYVQSFMRNEEDLAMVEMDLITCLITKNKDHGKPDKATFLRLTQEHEGVFNQIDFKDGKEHSYIEIGGWIGDQTLALQFMALGVHLGVFQLMTPSIVMPQLPKELREKMAGQGFITVRLR